MPESQTNRHGDIVRVGQLWLDAPKRPAQRTLHVDSLEDAGSLGTVAVCTVASSLDQLSGETTHPNRVVEINIDRLHTTRTGQGYLLKESS